MEPEIGLCLSPRTRNVEVVDKRSDNKSIEPSIPKDAGGLNRPRVKRKLLNPNAFSILFNTTNELEMVGASDGAEEVGKSVLEGAVDF